MRRRAPPDDAVRWDQAPVAQSFFPSLFAKTDKRSGESFDRESNRSIGRPNEQSPSLPPSLDGPTFVTAIVVVVVVVVGSGAAAVSQTKVIAYHHY